MKTYTVNQISDMLQTNPETVRRWIRDGKLKASKDSNKTGNVVSEDNLNEFLAKTPKYSGIALATLAGAGMVTGLLTHSVVATMLGAKFLSGSIKKNSSLQYNEKTIIELLKQNIEENEALINNNYRKIQSLQKEVSELEIKNETLRSYVQSMSTQDEEVD